MGNPAGAARRIRGEVDGVEMKRAAHAIPLACAAIFAGPGRQTGRMGALVRRILSEAPDHDEGEAIGEEPLGVYDGGFVAEAEVEVGADSGAEAAAEGD